MDDAGGQEAGTMRMPAGLWIGALRRFDVAEVCFEPLLTALVYPKSLWRLQPSGGKT